MSFIVTARKWRPKKFSEVVGQEHITNTLKNSIKENRVAHAYLFTGPRGVGKTTTARILARALNCENPVDVEPCGKCEVCVSIQNNQLIDIIEIDGASNRGIDEVRTLRDSVKYAPSRGKYKVYIIDEVHMLTKESFNAFLKTLEEPPEHIIFIFATTDVHKLPLTIISRCQRYDFRRIQLDTIKNTLKKIADTEKVKIDDTTLTIISKKADGALRDAESYFDQVIAYCNGKIDPDTVIKMLNLIDEEVYFKISDAALNKDYKVVFEVSNTLFENGWDYLDFMDGLTEHYRNILTTVLTNSSDQVETTEENKKKYIKYVESYKEGDLLRLLNFLNKSQQELKYTENQKLKIEISLSHLIGLEKTSTITDLISGLNSESKNLGSDISDEKSDGALKFSSKHSAPKTEDESVTKNIISENRVHPFKSMNEKMTPIPSASLQAFSFDEVVNKWQGFVDEISKEKALTLAPTLAGFNLLSLDGNRLSFALEGNQNKKTFEMNEKYIERKSEKYFGKKLRFELSDSGLGASQIINSAEELPNQTQARTTTSDPYEDIIINELGGEKIE